MLRTSLGLAAALLGLLLARAAGAQSWVNPYSGAAWNNPVSSQLDTMIRNRLLREAMERDQARRAEAEALPAEKRVTYRPAPSRTAEEFAATLFEVPQERAELARFLQGVLAAYRREAAGAGRKDDVAFALSYAICGWFAVYAEQDVSDEALAAVAEQLDGALAAMPGLREASDARRQSFAEQLICTTAFVLAGYQQAIEQRKEPQKKAFRALAAALLRKTVGAEPEQLQLTDAGLVVKAARR
jgi:hypothetical protein